jgi:hypothetical protein
MVTSPSWLVSTYFGTRSCKCSFSNCTPISMPVLKFSWAHTLYYVSLVPLFCQYWTCRLIQRDPLSPNFVDTVCCICCLFLFARYFVVIQNLVFLLSHFQFCFQITVDSHNNKLSTQLLPLLYVHYFTFQM